MVEIIELDQHITERMVTNNDNGIQEQQAQAVIRQLAGTSQVETTNREKSYFVVKIYKKVKFSIHSTAPDVSKGVIGLLNDIVKHKRFPGSHKLKVLYNCGLCIFYLINFLYPIVLFAIKGKHAGYNITCGIISFVALMYEACTIVVPHVYHKIQHWNEDRKKASQVKPVSINGDLKLVCIEDSENLSAQDRKHIKQDDPTNHAKKVADILKEFLVNSIGELLIYPSIICGLYGFINDKGWQFDSTLTVIDFVLLVYSFVMDAIYTKVQYIWLLQKMVSSSYATFDKSNNVSFSSLNYCEKLERCCSPFSLAVPYAITVILTYWVTLAIIGIRIYVDNFAIEKIDSVSPKNESEAGDYKTSPFTRYMIFCGAYFPIASALVYIIANKYWFIQMFETVQNDGSPSREMEEMSGYEKLFSFFIDPITYTVVVFLMVPFIPFAVGAFLPDYSSSDFIVSPTVRNTAHIFGFCFIGLFLFTNLQASMVFIIFQVIIIILLIILILAILTLIFYITATVYDIMEENEIPKSVPLFFIGVIVVIIIIIIVVFA